jgi:hypothetical protein
VVKGRQGPLDGVLWFIDAVLDTVQAAGELAAQSAPPNAVATVRFLFSAAADFIPGAGTTMNASQFLAEVYRNYRRRQGILESQDFRRQMEALAAFGDRPGDLLAEFDRRFAQMPKGGFKCDVSDVRKYVTSVPQFVKARTQQATAEVNRSGRHARIFSAEKLTEFLPPDLWRLQPGDSLRGADGVTITVLEPIGLGGFGEVWECEATGPELPRYQQFALKYCRDVAHRPIMKRDAEVLRELSNNRWTFGCAPRLFVDGTDQEVPWILMELVPDVHTLRHWFTELTAHGRPDRDGDGGEAEAIRRRNSGPMPILTLLEMAHRVAKVLQKTHEAQVGHGDLKPDNVLIGGDGVVRLVDFGSSRLDSSERRTLTLAGMRAGTPAYQPQRWRQDLQDDVPRLDVYAFGVILVEMLLGDPDLARHDSRLRDAHVPQDIIRLIDHMLDYEGKPKLDAVSVVAGIEQTSTWRIRQIKRRFEEIRLAVRTVVEAASDKYHGRTTRLVIGSDTAKTLAVNIVPLVLVAGGFGSFVMHIEGRKADHAVEKSCSSGDLDACRAAAQCRRTGDCSLTADVAMAERFEARIAFDRCELGDLQGCRAVISCHNSGACANQYSVPPLYYAKSLACRAGATEFCEAPEAPGAQVLGAAEAPPTPTQGPASSTVLLPLDACTRSPGLDACRQPAPGLAEAGHPPSQEDPGRTTVVGRRAPASAGERKRSAESEAESFGGLRLCEPDASDLANWQSIAVICTQLHQVAGAHQVDVRVSVPSGGGEPRITIWGEDGVEGAAVDCVKSRMLGSTQPLHLAPGCRVRLKLALAGK